MRSRKSLSADGMISTIRSIFSKIKDHRITPRFQTSITDALTSGFGVFSLKFPSLLQFEQERKSPSLSMKNLFQLENIPSDTQMRTIIDEIDPKAIRPAFKKLFSDLQRGKELEAYKYYQNHYLLSIDGTNYFKSNKVNCSSCLVKNHRGGKVSYYHQALAGSLVHPDKNIPIPLCPEPIKNEDGFKKNDCERNAVRRFINDFRREHPHLKVIVIQDALASNGPHIKLLKEKNMRFILNIKPGSHKYIFQSLEKHRKLGSAHRYSQEEEVGDKIKKRRTHDFEYVHGVQVHEQEMNLWANYIGYTETAEWVDQKGNQQKTVIRLSWITDLDLHYTNLMKLMRAGRSRWQIENETFNTLKNQGYNFEHNYGHGHKNLTTNFLLLMMLAFLYDQIQRLSCPLFSEMSKSFNNTMTVIRERVRNTYVLILNLDNWEQLYGVLIHGVSWEMNSS